MPCRIRITPRRFCEAARSGWRASMASSSFSACEKLFASNSRNALLYISSNSVFVGATLSAANELNAKAITAVIFQILMRLGLKLRSTLLTSGKLHDLQPLSENRHNSNSRRFAIPLGLDADALRESPAILER